MTKCEKCRKEDWDVFLRSLRGKLIHLCSACYKIEKIANDGD